MAKTNKRKEIWLVGGGTGGHVVPLLAVAEELKKDPMNRLYYLGERHGKEVEFAKRYKVPFIPISSGKLRRYITPLAIILNLRDIFLFLAGFLKSVYLILRRKPAVIFSKGGPVALPVGFAAWVTGTPLITHESDAIMGRANRLMARMAQKVLVAFPASVYPYGLAPKIQSVGLPLRSEFCTATRPTPGRKRPNLLIMGGSQGSLAINKLVAEILPQLLKEITVTHVTGEFSQKEFEVLRESLPPELASHYKVIGFTPDIADVIRDSSVIVMRSGSQIFEAASMSKPMVLIPLPNAANNHQVRNAEIFVQHKAALMLAQSNLTPERLYETISSVLTDATLRRELAEGTRAFHSCRAAKEVAAIVLSYCKE